MSAVNRFGNDETSSGMIINNDLSFHDDYYIPDNTKFEKAEKYNNYYMRQAHSAARMSYCKRKKVGAIVVKDGIIIADGWNGMPSGMDNTCETDNVTNPEVSHAEANAISKITRSHNSSEGADMYVTLAPCIECAKMIHNAGIKRVVVKNKYGKYGEEGTKYLEDRGVEVEHV